MYGLMLPALVLLLLSTAFLLVWYIGGEGASSAGRNSPGDDTIMKRTTGHMGVVLATGNTGGGGSTRSDGVVGRTSFAPNGVPTSPTSGAPTSQPTRGAAPHCCDLPWICRTLLPTDCMLL